MWKWNRQIIQQTVLRVYCDMRFRTAAVGVFAFTWWGILYPELCFSENTYAQVEVVDGQEIVTEQSDYHDILNASGDEIVIKSRLLEWIEQNINKQ